MDKELKDKIADLRQILEELVRNRKKFDTFGDGTFENTNEIYDITINKIQKDYIRKDKLGLNEYVIEKIILNAFLSGETMVKVDNISIDPIYCRDLANALSQHASEIIEEVVDDR